LEKKVAGLSVGWLDVYTAEIGGNYIDIKNTDSGTYLLRLTVNQSRSIEEEGGGNKFE
jgi:hypothetical protein